MTDTFRQVPFERLERADGTATATWRDWSVLVRVTTSMAAALPDAVHICTTLMARVDAVASRFRPDSELCRIEAQTSAGGDNSPLETRISPLLADLIAASLHVRALTDGAVDPTCGREIAELGYDADIDALALPASTSQRLSGDSPRRAYHPRDRSMDLTLHGQTLTLPRGIEIDLGSSAKAWSADRIAHDIVTATGAGALVELGGDLSFTGPTPPGGWKIDIVDVPGDPETFVAVNGTGGIATSSTLHRVWEKDGLLLHHILDPATGHSVRHTWRTATVIDSSCLRANAWSTAAIVWRGDALRRLEARRVPARLVDAATTTYVTSVWPSHLSPSVQDPAHSSATALEASSTSAHG